MYGYEEQKASYCDFVASNRNIFPLKEKYVVPQIICTDGIFRGVKDRYLLCKLIHDNSIQFNVHPFSYFQEHKHKLTWWE